MAITAACVCALTMTGGPALAPHGHHQPSPVRKVASQGRGNSVQLADLSFFEVSHNPDGKTVYGVRDARAACLAQAPYLEQLGEAYSRPKSSPLTPA